MSGHTVHGMVMPAAQCSMCKHPAGQLEKLRQSDASKHMQAGIPHGSSRHVQQVQEAQHDWLHPGQCCAASHLGIEVAVPAVQRYKQHPRVLQEDLLRAIAVVDLRRAMQGSMCGQASVGISVTSRGAATDHGAHSLQEAYWYAAL